MSFTPERWHLPWKTADGGVSWNRINKRMTEDSDVFSILVDSPNPSIDVCQRLFGYLQKRKCWNFFQ